MGQNAEALFKATTVLLTALNDTRVFAFEVACEVPVTLQDCIEGACSSHESNRDDYLPHMREIFLVAASACTKAIERAEAREKLKKQ